MKKIIMILMMMITFVGFTSNKPKDNFDYDKYVGYYVDTELDDDDFVNDNVKLLIKKDKKGDFFCVDYRMYYGSGFSRTRTIDVAKLNKINGTLQSKDKEYVFILKNNLLLSDNEKYRKIDDKMGKKWFSESEMIYGVKYRIFK